MIMRRDKSAAVEMGKKFISPRESAARLRSMRGRFPWWTAGIPSAISARAVAAIGRYTTN